MKDYILHTGSLFMAFLVMLSTMSFTINSHYCGGNLVDSSFFNKADTCGMEVISPDTNQTLMEGGCCSEEITSIKGQDELKLNFDQVDFNVQPFINSFVYSYIVLFEENSNSQITLEYPPPNISKCLYKLDEVYLI